MYENDFDPYDALIQALERIDRVEQAHNRLASAFQRTDSELNATLKALLHLQKTHVQLLNRIANLEQAHINK